MLYLKINKNIRKVILSIARCLAPYFVFHSEFSAFVKWPWVRSFLKNTGWIRIWLLWLSKSWTDQLLDSQLIEHWGRWGRGGGRVISCIHKAKGGKGHELFLKKHWTYLRGGRVRGLETSFFTAKISPSSDPKINPFTLSKGFFFYSINSEKKRRIKGEFLTFQLSLPSTQFWNRYIFLYAL